MTSVQGPMKRREIAFHLDDTGLTDGLWDRPDFAEHGPESAAQTISLAESIATDYLLPHYRGADEIEPHFEGGRAIIHPDIGDAMRALADAGFFAATHRAENGGLQLPYLVYAATLAFFKAANIATNSYAYLTIAAANLIAAHGSEEQKRLYLAPMVEGRFFGTMALTEPGAGSSLGDIRVRAEPAADGTYRLFGTKIFISAGDHDLGENIVHLVLARIKGGPAGVAGISLFIVPKILVGPDGALGAPNDVTLAGLIHKMGWRGTTSTVLSFGDKDGAVGYLVGHPGQGLALMFHMMNEARVGVSLGAAALAYAGYAQSLRYARERHQGRASADRSASSPQVPIIEHADVRRLIVTQKAYAEGTLNLSLYAARLIDDAATAPDQSERDLASRLLGVITPILKGWGTDACLKANDLAIQVHGGYGFTRDFPVEQYYRDNRLNPIHEGTNGIQAIDLLRRKIRQDGGAAFMSLLDLIKQEVDRPVPDVPAHALGKGVALIEAAVNRFLGQDRGQDALVGNAAYFLEASGLAVLGWRWLVQARAAARLLQQGCDDEEEQNYLAGKVQTAAYVMAYEVPRIPLMIELFEQNPALTSLRAAAL